MTTGNIHCFLAFFYSMNFYIHTKNNTYACIFSKVIFFSCISLFCVFLPIHSAFFIGLLNTFVHIVMYSYYGLAALGPHMQKYLWWKRYLTSLQLVQFVLLTIHTGYNLFTECDFPDSMNAVVFAYCISLIILFSNFYYRSYITRKSKMS